MYDHQMYGSRDNVPLGPGLSTAPPLSTESKGMLLGLAGVAIFSLTLPFTRMAVRELDPAFVTFGRALVAALLAAVWLWCNKAALAPLSALPRLLWLCCSHGAAIALVCPAAWLGFACISVFSVFIGFWYRGMALGGVARVSQIPLVQPFLSLIGAAVIVDEKLDASTILFALAVILVLARGRKKQIGL